MNKPCAHIQKISPGSKFSFKMLILKISHFCTQDSLSAMTILYRSILLRGFLIMRVPFAFVLMERRLHDHYGNETNHKETIIKQ